MTTKKQKIGLALSGGGVRAMAFHSGVMRWLAQKGLLEDIDHISSVSGGSLFIGLVLSSNNLKWPTSQEYLEKIEPKIKKILITDCLQKSAVIKLLKPSNWRYILSRANVLSKTIEELWSIKGNLNDLPSNPIWSINGTTAETGRRFRFKLDKCGDYELGYADAKYFSIAQAMAVSAAFPIGIGPLAIETADFTWKKKPWNASDDDLEEVILDFEKLHIYDGGIYDNLGIEPLFDIGLRNLKNDIDYLVVSDAGAPLERIAPKSILNPFRAIRLLDITMDQTRALRIRGYVNYLINNPDSGLYIQIGAPSMGSINKFKNQNEAVATALLRDDWLSAGACNSASMYETDLKKMEEDKFELLSRHGYETAKWNSCMFGVE